MDITGRTLAGVDAFPAPDALALLSLPLVPFPRSKLNEPANTGMGKAVEAVESFEEPLVFTSGCEFDVEATDSSGMVLLDAGGDNSVVPCVSPTVGLVAVLPEGAMASDDCADGSKSVVCMFNARNMLCAVSQASIAPLSAAKVWLSCRELEPDPEAPVGPEGIVYFAESSAGGCGSGGGGNGGVGIGFAMT